MAQMTQIKPEALNVVSQMILKEIDLTGTLRKINGSMYGVLVGESNTLAGQLSIKLQADGTA